MSTMRAFISRSFRAPARSQLPRRSKPRELDVGRLEGQSEAELQRARCVGKIRTGLRLQERAARLRQIVDAVVLPVEQVEHRETAGEIRLAVQRNPLLEAHLDAMNRLSDEAVARNDAAVGTLRIAEPQAVDAPDLQAARVAAADDLASQP